MGTHKEQQKSKRSNLIGCQNHGRHMMHLEAKTIKHTFSLFSPHWLPRICKPIFVLYHFWPRLIGGAQTMGHSHIQIDYVNEVDKELLVLKF
jgi:hypothetical protein